MFILPKHTQRDIYIVKPEELIILQWSQFFSRAVYENFFALYEVNRKKLPVNAQMYKNCASFFHVGL